MKDKVVLAYSGGLDTSVILKWLLLKDFEVICYIADVGQDEDFEGAKEKALQIGASKVYIEDLKEEFVKDYIFKAIKASALYENRYLLGTSLARPIIAKYQIEIARKENAKYVSHGATGKGNDQVRFELGYYSLMPEVKVLAPWKMDEFLAEFQGRKDLLDYAEKHKIEVEATLKKPYSMDANLMHISYEAGLLEDPAASPPEDMFKMTVSPLKAPDKETNLEVFFENGEPSKIKNLDDNFEVTEPLELFKYANKLAGENGIGRIDIVENRFVGIKSRGVYETPGGTLLFLAHQDLETLAIDREVYKIKNDLVPKYAELIYNGFWFSPEFEFLTNSIDESQKTVNGSVILKLYKGNVIITGRKADNSLYNEELSSMDIEGGYNQKDAEGFININAIRLKVS